MHTGDIQALFDTAIDLHQSLRNDTRFIHGVEKMGIQIIEALQNGKKLLIAGNGGSAAEAQHFAAEIVNRFEMDRRALSALSLSTDTSILTSAINDFPADWLFSRQIEAHGVAGDVFCVLTSSGNSANLLRALKTAKERRLHCIGLLGRDGGKAKALCHESLIVPATSTARVQEIHLLVIHIICTMIDRAFTSSS